MKKMNNTLRNVVGATLAAGAMFSVSNAQACNDQPYLGMVCMTAANYCPRNYAEANGALISIASNNALFAVIGTQYGGDGRTTFALPDLRGRSAIGWGTGTGLSPVMQGQKRGNEYTQPTVSTMAQHTHTATTSGGSAEVQASTNGATHPVAAAGDYIASNSGLNAAPKFISASGAGTTVALGGVSGGAGTVTVASTGGNQSYSNMPPQLGMRFCVATQGLFPPRN